MANYFADSGWGGIEAEMKTRSCCVLRTRTATPRHRAGQAKHLCTCCFPIGKQRAAVGTSSLVPTTLDPCKSALLRAHDIGNFTFSLPLGALQHQRTEVLELINKVLPPAPGGGRQRVLRQGRGV